MPENSVYFTTLVEPVYEPESLSYGGAQFHAALYDPKTGKLVGRVCTIRTDFVKEVLP